MASEASGRTQQIWRNIQLLEFLKTQTMNIINLHDTSSFAVQKMCTESSWCFPCSLLQFYTKPRQFYTMPRQFYTKPRQFYTMPRQFYTKPSQFYTKPRQFCTKPRQFYTKPRQFYTKPRQFYMKPRQFYRKPRQFDMTPRQFYMMPGQFYMRPGQFYTKPRQFYTNPGNNTVNLLIFVAIDFRVLLTECLFVEINFRGYFSSLIIYNGCINFSQQFILAKLSPSWLSQTEIARKIK